MYSSLTSQKWCIRLDVWIKEMKSRIPHPKARFTLYYYKANANLNAKHNTKVNTNDILHLAFLLYNQSYIHIHRSRLVIIKQSFYKCLARFRTSLSHTFELLARLLLNRFRRLALLSLSDQAYMCAGGSEIWCLHGPQSKTRSTDAVLHTQSKTYAVKFVGKSNSVFVIPSLDKAV